MLGTSYRRFVESFDASFVAKKLKSQMIQNSGSYFVHIYCCEEF